jgi:predicted nucleic acid-binding protein
MIALDTNVLLYACDRADSRRQQIAIDLIVDNRDGVLLWQVAGRFVAPSLQTERTRLRRIGCLEPTRRISCAVAPHPSTLGVLERGQRLHATHGVSSWDALILAACAEAGVKTPYSGDVPGLPTLGGLQVLNPFK